MSEVSDSKKPTKPATVLGALLTAPVAIVASTAITSPALAATETNTPENGSLPSLSGQSIERVSTSPAQALHTVQTGETVAGIASEHGLTVKNLLDLNHLPPAAIVFPGQVLRLIGDTIEPSVVTKMVGATQHEVTEGETLHAIARKYDVKLSSLLALNKLSSDSLLFPGQVLNLREVTPQVSSARKTGRESEHEVAEGETLTSVAKLHGVSLTSLLKANSLTRTSLIFVGQILDIPEIKSTPPSALDSFGNSIGKPTTICLFHGFHKIKAGETISKLAAKFGVSQQSVLTANRLTWNSTIFIGQKLIIPDVHKASDCPDLTALSDEMAANAKLIIETGRNLGVPDYGIVIALATAMQESSLRNVSFGDRDSVGLFQQRPSAHWGTKAEIMDATYAAKAFFGGLTSPTRGVARGLLDIHGWQNLSLTEAAQAVQISAHPTAYAKWEPSAWKWLSELDGLEDS